MGLSGCGPTTLSMAAAFLLKKEALSPAYIAKFSEENGFSSYKNSTMSEISLIIFSGLGFAH